MKTSILKSFSIVAGFALIALACSKSDSAPAVSTDDAANTVGSYVSTDFTSTASDATTVYTTTGSKAGREASGGRAASSSCSVTFDSTFTRSGSLGSLITYSFQLDYMYKLSCNGIVPSSLDFQFTSAGTYTGSKVSSQGNSTGDWTMAGFNVAASSYTVNGTVNRTETITEIGGAAKTFSSTLALTANGVSIDKTTKKILGGTMTLTMAGAVTGGKSYNYTGTVTFEGNGAATILIGTTTYTVNLTTGTVTKS